MIALVVGSKLPSNHSSDVKEFKTLNCPNYPENKKSRRFLNGCRQEKFDAFTNQTGAFKA